MNTPTQRDRPSLSIFRDVQFWGGVVFVAAGVLLENLVGGEHAFEYLLLFGGLFIGFAGARSRLQQTGQG